MTHVSFALKIAKCFSMSWILSSAALALAQGNSSHKECLTQENRITIACGNKSCPGGTRLYRSVNEAHPTCNRNSSDDVFRIPCGGGTIEGSLGSYKPVVWKVEGKPEVTIFQSVGPRPTLLTHLEVCGSGVVASFANFNSEAFVTYSPSCTNLFSGGDTILTFRGHDYGIMAFAPDPRGGITIDAYHNHRRGARFAKFYSPNCLNPMGGGKTQILQDWKKIR